MALVLAGAGESRAAEGVATLYSVEFQAVPLGTEPAGWLDLIDHRPSRNWAVDGKGFLRVMLKEYVGNPAEGDRLRRREYLERGGFGKFAGVLVYDGLLADGAPAKSLGDVTAEAWGKKTPDRNVFVGVLLRVQDGANYYEARVTGANRLALIKVENGKESMLGEAVMPQRLTDGAPFSIRFRASGANLSASVQNGSGLELVKVDAKDATWMRGWAGLSATTFGAFSKFVLFAPGTFVAKHSAAEIEAANSRRPHAEYPVVRAVEDPATVETPFSKLAESYDVVVAGAGTGGLGAALQAARLGAKVLLIEETDHLGGQMGNAAVTSMDDGGIWGKNPVRERGIYREFHESAVNHYYTLEKDPFTAYKFNLQSEGGFEPRVARGVLLGLIEETRRNAPSGARLDYVTRTKVSGVGKTGDAVNRADIEHWTEQGSEKRSVACKVLVDATEYGDVIPLTGARYRVGVSTSDNMDPASPVQDHTWVGVIREYPEGIPDDLKIKNPPPGYETIKRRMKGYQLYGEAIWGGEHRGVKGPRLWWVYAAWRGMPDSGSPATGELTEQRHTKCGLNGGNDYPVNAATMEDPVQRAKDELEGINRTLGIVYWFQNELGLPWAVADEEGYFSPYSLERMKQRGVREDLLPVAARFPQWPYVRESRRIIGVETLRGEDLYTRDRGTDAAKHWASAVAINDYSFDLHGTEDSLEEGLDEHDYINATGPFAVPFGVFIPEKIDGFVPAEKNFSQSRLANGATRLQPSTMLTGQAAGAIAALAALKSTQPRNLNIIEVQASLLDAGDSLVSRWYRDVPYGTPLWRATQLLTLYGAMDRPGALLKEQPLGHAASWGADEKLGEAERKAVLARLAAVVPKEALPGPLAGTFSTRAEFALAAAELLRDQGRYVVTDPAPFAPPHDFAKARKADKKRNNKSDKGNES